MCHRVFELNAFVSRIVFDNLSDLFVQIYRDATPCRCDLCSTDLEHRLDEF